MCIISIIHKKFEDKELKSYEQVFNEEWLPKIIPAKERMDGEDAILEAVFSQYSSVLQRCSIGDAIASFNFSTEFDIENSPRLIFELYKTICHNNHIKPLAIDFIGIERYIPYIPIPSLINLVKESAFCYLHLRKRKVHYFSTLSGFPSDEEIYSTINKCQDDTVSCFLLLLLNLLISIESFLIDYDLLASAYNSFVMGYLAFSMKDKTKEGEELFIKAISIFEEKLKPFESRLKQESIIEKEWSFSYCEIPLSSTPYYEKFGEKVYYEIGTLWNLSRIRSDSFLQKYQADLHSIVNV